MSEKILLTVEDLSSGKKYGTEFNKTADASDVAEAVRRTLLEIQGCDFISVKALGPLLD